MTRLIGLTGKAGSGKDTVARLILSHIIGYEINEEKYFFSYRDLESLNSNINVVSLAQPLYEMVSGLTGMSVSWLIENKKSEFLGKSIRHLLQTLGTEWGRNVLDINFWVNHLDLRIKLHYDYTETIVIPDVRFENEADYIHSRGGEIWLIEREVPTLEHASEGGISPPKITKTIQNHGNLNFLNLEVLRCLNDTT